MYLAGNRRRANLIGTQRLVERSKCLARLGRELFHFPTGIACGLIGCGVCRLFQLADCLVDFGASIEQKAPRFATRIALGGSFLFSNRRFALGNSQRTRTNIIGNFRCLLLARRKPLLSRLQLRPGEH
jgi:hypothetical protein